MDEHNWREERFDVNSETNGVRGCVQHYVCRACGATLSLPFGCSTKDFNGTTCSPTKSVYKKEAWRSPNKKEYRETRDYPAKKGARR